MNDTNYKREIGGSLDEAVARVTSALAGQGFGILTRIDMDKKILEKTGKKIVPTVILGACNPTLAYEAYTANSDVAGLLPCNAVVRELDKGRISIEFTKPSAMMRILGDNGLVKLAVEADENVKTALFNV